jgi:hypothetical protein
MDTQSVLTFIAGYFATAVTVFMLYSPGLILFVVLLLVAGLLQLVAWPFVVLIRRLRRRLGKFDDESDSSWLLH